MPSARAICPRSRALVMAALAPLVASAYACDPAYEPPPRGPSTVYIPWQTGPARGRPRRTTVAPTSPTAAPSVAPGIQLEDVDGEGDAGADAPDALEALDAEAPG